MGLEAGIWASRLGLGPHDWGLGLETGIWASRLGFEGEGRMEEEEEEEKEKEVKIPHICESIGHRPLWPLPYLPFNFKHNLLRQGTGTADHKTRLRLLLFWCF